MVQYDIRCIGKSGLIMSRLDVASLVMIDCVISGFDN